ncbi:MAG: ABC transporter ATP-binding protein [Oligoflexia bacterium]|nr:ABC transporter ATP-binding protein [Oligoflexia bacterium]
MANTNHQLLSVRQLSVKRGGRRVVDDVSFELLPGMLMAIVGANGAGKSSLLKALVGIIPTSAGVVEWGGERIDHPRKRAQRLGYVPQLYSFPGATRVREFVASGLFPELGRFGSLVDEEGRVASALERIGCSNLIDRSVAALSGGEAQRVLLAAALVHRPSVLLLDEPGSFLDPKHDEGMYRLLKDLAKSQGCGVLVVSHDVNASVLHSDQVLALGQGRQQYCGPGDGFMCAEVFRRVFDCEPVFVKHPSSGVQMVLPRNL